MRGDNLHFQDLAGNEEANSNWGEVDDPGRHLQQDDQHHGDHGYPCHCDHLDHLHHNNADALKELEKGFSFLPALSDCNSRHHSEHDQPQDVRRAGKGR